MERKLPSSPRGMEWYRGTEGIRYQGIVRVHCHSERERWSIDSKDRRPPLLQIRVNRPRVVDCTLFFYDFNRHPDPRIIVGCSSHKWRILQKIHWSPTQVSADSVGPHQTSQRRNIHSHRSQQREVARDSSHPKRYRLSDGHAFFLMRSTTLEEMESANIRWP